MPSRTAYVAETAYIAHSPKPRYFSAIKKSPLILGELGALQHQRSRHYMGKLGVISASDLSSKAKIHYKARKQVERCTIQQRGVKLKNVDLQGVRIHRTHSTTPRTASQVTSATHDVYSRGGAVSFRCKEAAVTLDHSVSKQASVDVSVLLLLQDSNLLAMPAE